MSEIIGGRYELLTELTAGPFGTVHRARNTVLDTAARLTLLAPALTDRPEVLNGFGVRASAAVALEHRCAVRVIEFGADAAPRYLVEDLVEGPTLTDRLASVGALLPGQALVIVGKLARMLVVAHERGVIHGAVHAGAVVLEGGDPARPRLGDFALDPRWLEPIPD